MCYCSGDMSDDVPHPPLTVPRTPRATVKSELIRIELQTAQMLPLSLSLTLYVAFIFSLLVESISGVDHVPVALVKMEPAIETMPNSGSITNHAATASPLALTEMIGE